MSNVRSWVQTALTGEDGMELQSRPRAACGPDEMRIKVRAASVNFPDVLIGRGLYQHRKEPPFMQGGELAGEIVEAGANVKRFKVGDRVCGLAGGAFAEEIVSKDTGMLFPMPASMPFEEGAALSIVYGTGAHALIQRAALREGETMLVLGAAGGCGGAAVELGKAMGANVISGASTDEKCAVAKKLGADAVVNYSTENLRERVMEWTGGKGVDVVFDPVGDKLFEEARRCVGWMGRYLVIGFAGGKIPSLSINYVLLKSMSLVGVAWGVAAMKDPAMNRANFEQLFAWYEAGKIKPYVGKRYAFEHAREACADMYAGNAIGKSVIEMAG